MRKNLIFYRTEIHRLTGKVRPLAAARRCAKCHTDGASNQQRSYCGMVTVRFGVHIIIIIIINSRQTGRLMKGDGFGFARQCWALSAAKIHVNNTVEFHDDSQSAQRNMPEKAQLAMCLSRNNFLVTRDETGCKSFSPRVEHLIVHIIIHCSVSRSWNPTNLWRSQKSLSKSQAFWPLGLSAFLFVWFFESDSASVTANFPCTLFYSLPAFSTGPLGAVWYIRWSSFPGQQRSAACG